MSRFIIAASLVFFTGCMFLREPYPGWVVDEVTFEGIPQEVRTAILADLGEVRVVRVERSTFQSRKSGYPKKYRLFYSVSPTETERVIYDSKGKRDDNFDFWFDRLSTDQEN